MLFRLAKSIGFLIKETRILHYISTLFRVLKINLYFYPDNDSDLFALERNQGLKAILGTIYQSFDGVDLYPTIEEKCSNFFYLVIKNHTLLMVIKELLLLYLSIFLIFIIFYIGIIVKLLIIIL